MAQRRRVTMVHITICPHFTMSKIIDTRYSQIHWKTTLIYAKQDQKSHDNGSSQIMLIISTSMHKIPYWPAKYHMISIKILPCTSWNRVFSKITSGCNTSNSTTILSQKWEQLDFKNNNSKIQQTPISFYNKSWTTKDNQHEIFSGKKTIFTEENTYSKHNL